MKIRVRHYLNNRYIIEYKRWGSWEQYTYAFQVGSIMDRDQPYFYGFEEAKRVADTLSWEKIKAHNKRQNEIHKERLIEIDRVENEQNSRYWETNK